MKIIIWLALAGIILLCSLPAVAACPACDSTKTTCTYEREYNYYPSYPTTEDLGWMKVKCYYDQSRRYLCYWTHSQKVCEKYDLYQVCETKKYCCNNDQWELIPDKTTRTLVEKGKVKCTIEILESKVLPYGQTP
jgi:hypothetical protein